MMRDTKCLGCSDVCYGDNGVVLCHQCDHHMFYSKNCDDFVEPKIDHVNLSLACRRCNNSFDLKDKPATVWEDRAICGKGNSPDALLVGINNPFTNINDMVTVLVKWVVRLEEVDVTTTMVVKKVRKEVINVS